MTDRIFLIRRLVDATTLAFPAASASAELPVLESEPARIDGLIDGFGRAAHLNVVGKRAPEVSGDLRRRPLHCELLADHGVQPAALSDAERLRPAASDDGLVMGKPGLISAIGLLVAADLAIDVWKLLSIEAAISFTAGRRPGRQQWRCGRLGTRNGRYRDVGRGHAPGVDKPQRPAAGGYSDTPSRGRSFQATADQLKVLAADRRGKLVVSPTGHEPLLCEVRNHRWNSSLLERAALPPCILLDDPVGDPTVSFDRMPKRRERIAPPPANGGWDFRYATSEAVTGWENVCAAAPGNARVAWQRITSEPGTTMIVSIASRAIWALGSSTAVPWSSGSTR